MIASSVSAKPVKTEQAQVVEKIITFKDYIIKTEPNLPEEGNVCYICEKFGAKVQ